MCSAEMRREEMSEVKFATLLRTDDIICHVAVFLQIVACNLLCNRQGGRTEAHNILFPHFGSAAAATATRMRNLFPISNLKKLSTANFEVKGGGRRRCSQNISNI